MPGAANDVWWDDLRQEAELPPPEPPTRSRTPIIVGLLAATAIAGGLGWWLSSPSKTYFDNPTIQPAPAVAARVAAPGADAEQVRRAYDEFSLVYANSGDEGLTRFAESCEASLRADPRILDFCLAFDLFAGAVRDPGADASGDAQARRVALVQTAAPGADPDLRIAEVRRLMRDATGFTTAEAVTVTPSEPPVQVAQAPAAPAATTPTPTPTPPPTPAAPSSPVRVASAPAAAPAPKPVRLARATPPRRAAAAGSACRLRSTPAERLMCANPTLRIQERRMKEAYERALGAGADPLVVDRAQAEWRTLRNAADTRGELADLYARRTRELNAAAEPVTTTPPT